MTEKELKKQMVADVMDGFDFTRVRTVMLAIDWKWAIREDELVVPGMWRIIDTAKSLLEEVVEYYGDGKVHIKGTGGFMASIDEDGNLALQFILAEMVVEPAYYEK